MAKSQSLTIPVKLKRKGPLLVQSSQRRRRGSRRILSSASGKELGMHLLYRFRLANVRPETVMDGSFINKLETSGFIQSVYKKR